MYGVIPDLEIGVQHINFSIHFGLTSPSRSKCLKSPYKRTFPLTRPFISLKIPSIKGCKNPRLVLSARIDRSRPFNLGETYPCHMSGKFLFRYLGIQSYSAQFLSHTPAMSASPNKERFRQNLCTFRRVRITGSS